MSALGWNAEKLDFVSRESAQFYCAAARGSLPSFLVVPWKGDDLGRKCPV